MKKALSLLTAALLACTALFTLQSCTPKDPVPEFCQMYNDDINGMPWSEQKIQDTFGDEALKEYVLTEADKQEVIDMVTKALNARIDKEIQALDTEDADSSTQAEIDEYVAQAKKQALETFSAQINNCKTFGDLLDAFGDMKI